MARFLKTSDYSSIIQAVDLAQITEGVDQNLFDSEIKAISRMRTKLVQRYLVDIELGTMTAFSAATHYRTRDRVINGETITHVNDFNRWDKTTDYVIGDIVTDDNGYVYTAIADSTNTKLTVAGVWQPMVNVLTSNATYWTVGDNRYPMFIELAMDMTLYNLHARINPRNIPELRIERNREALDQLDRWASGTDTAEVLNINIADSEGFSIRTGNSLDKQNNFFI
jgi:hypothetical protein